MDWAWRSGGFNNLLFLQKKKYFVIPPVVRCRYDSVGTTIAPIRSDSYRLDRKIIG